MTAVMNNRALTLLALLLITFMATSMPCRLSAQDAATDDVPGNDKPERKKQDRIDFSVKSTGFFSRDDLVLRDTRYLDRSVYYQPDVHWGAGVMASYKNFGIGYRIGIPGTGADFYKAQSYDIRAFYYHRFVGVDGYYRRCRGFRITDAPVNTENLWNDGRGGSNMKGYFAGISLFVQMENLTVFNKRFSYGSAFEQTEKQKKHGGAILILLSADYVWIDNSTFLIPPVLYNMLLFSRLYGLTGLRSIGFAFGLGYSYNIVFGDFFIAPLVTLAINPLEMNFFTVFGDRGSFVLDSFKGEVKLSAGYMGDRFIAAVFFGAKAKLVPYGRMNIYQLSIRAGLSAGIRF